MRYEPGMLKVFAPPTQGLVMAVEDVVGVDLQQHHGRVAVCRHRIEPGITACMHPCRCSNTAHRVHAARRWSAQA